MARKPSKEAAPDPPRGPPEVLTVLQAAELLQVNPTTIRRMAAAGTLPATKVGRAWRFNRAALLAFIAKE